MDPAVSAFVADSWPDAAPDKDSGAYVAEYTTESGSLYTLRLWTSQSTRDVAGVSMPVTDSRVDAIFDSIVPRGNDRVEARAHAERVVKALEEHLVTVPVDFVVSEVEPGKPRLPLVVLARHAADITGDPATYRDLIEVGSWTGVVLSDDLAAVHLKLSMKYASAMADEQVVNFDAAVTGEDLARLGPEPAAKLATETIEGFIERLEARATETHVVARAEVSARPRLVPEAFYSATDIVAAFFERFKGRRVPFWNGGDRWIVTANDDSRIALTMALKEESGQATATVRIAVERADNEYDAAEIEKWQESADGVAAQIERVALAQESAPSFSLAVPVETVMAELARRLPAMFPSRGVSRSDTGFSVSNFELGEEVWGSVTVRVEAQSDYETRVTFKGALRGNGLGKDPATQAQSRQAYRAIVASSAAQIRDEITADVAPPPPSAPDVGLE